MASAMLSGMIKNNFEIGDDFLICFIVICYYACSIIISLAIMPETENRTLEEVEAHFSDKTIKLTNTNVKRIRITKSNGAA